jgi:ABC-type nitrate/sulfonate/bicarbonate transport system substrate-binding protein
MSFHPTKICMQRPLLLIAVVSALVIGSNFFACTRADQKPMGPPEKITIAYATPPYTALADIAQAQGYFRLEGLEATPSFHSTGKDALEEVLEGKADVATVSETAVMFAIMNGQKISIIATIQAYNKTVAIISRKDRGIRTPLDLEGKRIAVPLGTGGEFFLNAFLTAQGISRQDVTMVNLKIDKMTDALANGDVDAVSTWQPFLSQTQKKLGDKGITFYDEDIYMQTFNIVATQGYIHKNPARINKMLRALIKAEEFVVRNPAEAQKIVAEFRKMDRTLLSNMWEGNTFSVTLDQSLLFALEDESRWAIKSGLTGKTNIPNYLDYIYLDGLTSVKPKAVRIVR